MAHLRHRQGRRLPRRPGRRRGDVQGGHRRGPRPGEDGPAVQPHARGQDRPAPVRRAHPQPRRGRRAPLLLRGRPHRPHDPADALPAVHQAGRRVLQRVLRPRPADDRRPRSAASSPTSWPPARSTSSPASRSCSPPAASARSSRRRPTRTPSPATAWASSGARACRWRTWSSSSSTRPAWPVSASCCPRRRAARAASCATTTASASWSATPRPSRTSRRATWSPARWPTRCARAAAAGPNKDYVYLDLTHLEPEHIDAKLPDITEFARTYLGVEPYTEPVPVFPTAHYAMGGVPTNIEAEVLRNNDDVVPGLYAAGEVACVSVHGANRLGTNSLLDINVFGRRAGITAAEYAQTRRATSTLPDDPARPSSTAWSSRCATSTGGERVAAIRADLQATMDLNAQVFRTEGSLKQALGDIEALKARYRRRRRAGQGQALQHRPARGRRARLPARPGRGARRVGALARNESRGGHFREDYADPRRRELHAAHDGLPRGRPTTASSASASTTSPSSDPLPADGAQVLMDVTLKIRRYNPEVAEEHTWETLRRSSASRPTACSTPCTRSSGTRTAR